MGESTDPIRVVHVDDEPGFAEMTGQFLERASDAIEVRTATGAEKGLDVVEGGDVDCVVSDYDMPGRDGIEFLEAVREDHPNLPFILFTGKGSEEIASDAISAGVTDYLQKGGGTDQYAVLANRITNVVEGARAEQRLERSQRELAETSQTLDAVFEASPLAIVAIDPGGTVRFWNDAAESTFGWSESEVLGEQMPIVPESKTDEFARLRERVLDGESFTGVRITRRTKSGEEVNLVLSTAPVRDADGDINGIMAVLEEVTEREQKFDDLRERARQILRAGDVETVAERTVATAHDVLGMPITGFWLYDESEQALVPVAVTDAARELFDEPEPYYEDEGLSWDVFREGEVMVFDDVSTHPDRYNPDTQLRSELILPVGTYGVVNAGSTDVGVFDDSDVMLGRLLAANAEGALNRISASGERPGADSPERRSVDPPAEPDDDLTGE